MKAARNDVLPASLPPLGINREQAATLIGISVSLFDRAVEAGTMPKPRVLGGRNIWDVAEIAEHFRAIPHKDEGSIAPVDRGEDSSNPWD